MLQSTVTAVYTDDISLGVDKIEDDGCGTSSANHQLACLEMLTSAAGGADRGPSHVASHPWEFSSYSSISSSSSANLQKPNAGSSSAGDRLGVGLPGEPMSCCRLDTGGVPQLLHQQDPLSSAAVTDSRRPLHPPFYTPPADWNRNYFGGASTTDWGQTRSACYYETPPLSDRSIQRWNSNPGQPSVVACQQDQSQTSCQNGFSACQPRQNFQYSQQHQFPQQQQQQQWHQPCPEAGPPPPQYGDVKSSLAYPHLESCIPTAVETLSYFEHPVVQPPQPQPYPGYFTTGEDEYNDAGVGCGYLTGMTTMTLCCAEDCGACFNTEYPTAGADCAHQLQQLNGTSSYNSSFYLE